MNTKKTHTHTTNKQTNSWAHLNWIRWKSIGSGWICLAFGTIALNSFDEFIIERDREKSAKSDYIWLWLKTNCKTTWTVSISGICFAQILMILRSVRACGRKHTHTLPRVNPFNRLETRDAIHKISTRFTFYVNTTQSDGQKNKQTKKKCNWIACKIVDFRRAAAIIGSNSITNPHIELQVAMSHAA